MDGENIMSTSLAVLNEQQPVGLLRPIAAPSEIVKAQEETRALITSVLKEGRDYGSIQGVNRKVLFKAGAERTALGFACYYGDPEIVEKEIEHDREVFY